MFNFRFMPHRLRSVVWMRYSEYILITNEEWAIARGLLLPLSGTGAERARIVAFSLSMKHAIWVVIFSIGGWAGVASQNVIERGVVDKKSD